MDDFNCSNVSIKRYTEISMDDFSEKEPDPLSAHAILLFDA